LQTTMAERADGRLRTDDVRDFLLRTIDALPTGRITDSSDGFYRIGRVPGVIVQAAEQTGIRNLRVDYSRICLRR